MIHVDPDWWKTLFDEVYLLTDAPFVCNADVTKHEVDVVERLLPLSPTEHILDLCGGQGRHAIELVRRGYAHVTVLDYSDFLLQQGRQEAAALALPVVFCQGDARATSLATASVDVVLVMANSFGFFVDAADDRRVLTEVVRLLAPGGRFLLDLINRDMALQQFRPESWHEATNDIVVCWKRELAHDMVHVREMVLSKRTGLLRDRTYAERLYSRKQICTLLQDVGFEKIEIQCNVLGYHPDSSTDYGLATNRMVVTAMKRP